MRINKQIVLGIAILTSFVIAITLPVYFAIINRNQYSIGDPIIIWNDDDFSIYKLEGEGSVSDPYLIDGHNITTNSYYGIFIKGVTKHFTIRNCFIDAYRVGIYIENTADGLAIIEENVLFNNIDYGVQIIDSDDITVSNNTCLSSADQITNQGISIAFSSNSLVYNNTCVFQEVRGISVLHSPYSEINSNNCSDNSNFGLFVDESPFLTIEDNVFQNNGLNGLSITLSPNTVISKNNFTDTGLLFWEYYVEDFVSYTVEDNFANNQPIGFYKNLENQIIDSISDGQVFYVNCSDVILEKLDLSNVLGFTMSFCNNITIKNSEFSNIPRPGLLLWYCEESTVINTTCSYNNADGLAIAYSNKIDVENSTFQYNSKNGIRILHSTESYLFNNTCQFNERTGNYEDMDGIQLLFSSNSTLMNNTCYNNGDDGITLYVSENNKVINNTSSMNVEGLNLFLANDSIILNNTFDGDHSSGIYMQPSDNVTISGNYITNTHEGIIIRGSSYCKILDNYISNNIEGIVFVTLTPYVSVSNEIHHNLFTDNDQYAIRLVSDCLYTRIHHNAFYDNYPEADSQAYDSSPTSFWYDSLSSEGNFWDDWVSGDYLIDGSAENYDIYPLSSNPIS